MTDVVETGQYCASRSSRRRAPAANAERLLLSEKTLERAATPWVARFLGPRGCSRWNMSLANSLCRSTNASNGTASWSRIGDAARLSSSICDLIGKAIKHPPARQGFEGGRFAYIVTTYAAGKDIAWEMLKAYSRPFIAELPNESELRVDFWNGARIKIYGSDNPDALRGRGFDMVVLDEYADMPPSLFPAVIRPALAEKNGRTIFIGTVRSRENQWQTYQAAIN